MMIKTEQPYIDARGKIHDNLVRTYSDADLMIRQVETGIEYAEAIDIVPCRYTYEETDKSVPIEDEMLLGIIR